MAKPDSSLRAPECPRCGYDLRGTVDTWHDACPIEGRCGECGLAFAWRDVLIEDVLAPAWCVEFASRRRVPRAVLSTFARSFLPWRFWSVIRMTHAARPWRLAVYAAAIALGCYGVLAISNGVQAYRDWTLWFSPGGYGKNTMSRAEAVTRATLLPFSGEPLGRFSWAGGRAGSSPYKTPREFVGLWFGDWLPVQYAAYVVGLGPLVLIGLVVSRRRAGVRPRHAGRVLVYSLGWILLLCASGLAASVLYERIVVRGWIPVGLAARGDYIMMVLGPAFVLLWWQAAARRYLRMEHSWAVAGAVTVLALGGGLAMMMATGFGFLQDLFDRLGLL